MAGDLRKSLTPSPEGENAETKVFAFSLWDKGVRKIWMLKISEMISKNKKGKAEALPFCRLRSFKESTTYTITIQH